MRTDDAADHVKRIVDSGRPLAEGFVGRIFERLGPAVYRMHVRAEQLHDVTLSAWRSTSSAPM